jgi:hypothetical protein
MTMPKKKSVSMEERLRGLGAKLDDLLAHAQKTKDYATKINLEELKRQKGQVERKLMELRGPAREAVTEIRAGLNTAWRDVRKSLSRAKGKFKK